MIFSIKITDVEKSFYSESEMQPDFIYKVTFDILVDDEKIGYAKKEITGEEYVYFEKEVGHIIRVGNVSPYLDKEPTKKEILLD